MAVVGVATQALDPSSLGAAAPDTARNFQAVPDLSYAANANPRQMLDLYLPAARAAEGRLPVIVFIHGGGWVGGSKEAGRVTLLRFVEDGAYAGVSVGYRLAGEAPWPAPIHDCKAAIRWIRAHADQYGLDPGRIGVVGSSAGGTLATLLGLTDRVRELEGTVGPHLGESSRVTCVHNRFGRLNFLAEPESARSAPAQAKALAGRLQTLFGGPLEDRVDVARRASAINYITPETPPILTTHGTRDTVVPFAQALEFDAAMKRAGRPHLLIPAEEFGHGYQDAEDSRRSRQFFDRHLRGASAAVATEPLVARPKKQR